MSENTLSGFKDNVHKYSHSAFIHPHPIAPPTISAVTNHHPHLSTPHPITSISSVHYTCMADIGTLLLLLCLGQEVTLLSLLPAAPRSVMKGHHLMQAHLITRVPSSLQEPSRPAQVEERLPNQLQRYDVVAT